MQYCINYVFISSAYPANIPILRSRNRAKVATIRFLLVDVKVTGACTPSSRRKTSCSSSSGNIIFKKQNKQKNVRGTGKFVQTEISSNENADHNLVSRYGIPWLMVKYETNTVCME